MSSTLKSQIADAIDVGPGRIWRFVPEEGGVTYTVLLHDYRKFTGVTPTPKEQMPELKQNDHFTVIETDRGKIYLTDEQMAVLEKPEKATRAKLRQVGEALFIPGASGKNKAPLIRAITQWRNDAIHGTPIP
jgi:hypothetical protein